MVGFLLEQDAVEARKSVFDDWLEQRKREAERAAQAAQQTAQTAATTVQQAVQAAPEEVAQRARAFDDWLATRTPPQTAPPTPTQPIVQPPAVPQVAPQPSAPAAAEVPTTPEAQQRSSAFDQWLQERNQPPLAGALPVGPAPLTQAPSQHPDEEPTAAGGTAGVASGADKWQTQFDFGQTYTGNYRTGTPHRGVDLTPRGGGGIGTPVEAFAPGTVTNISRDSGAGGLMVYVQDDQGLTHAYMHLAGTAPGLKVGDVVARGQPIAQMGESGTEGSPHLHYEVRKNAATGDPLDQLIDPRPYVAGAQGPTVARTTAQPGSVTRTTAELSGGGPQGNLSDRAQQILSGAGDMARAFGDDAVKAVQSVLITEGGLNNARGDNGQSAGPLQFYSGGPGQPGQLDNFARDLGMGIEQAKQWIEQNPLAAVRWALGTPDKPGYLGQAILSALQQGRRGPDLATAIQANGQRSVSPERAGDNFRNLFGQGQAAVTSAAQSATEGLLRTGTDIAARGEALAGETGRLARESSERARAAMDQLQQSISTENDRYSAARRADIGRTFADIMQPRQFGADMLPEPVRDLTSGFRAPDVSSGFGNVLAGAAQRFTNEPMPMTGGQSLADLGRTLTTPPDLQTLRTMLEAGEAEQRRQQTEGLPTQAARFGAGLVGQQLSPEAEQLVRGATPRAVSGALSDPGGVVSGMLKAGGLQTTVPLPGLGDVSLADVIGLAVNLRVPIGAEARFGEGPLRTGLTELSRLGRPSQQLGPMLAIEQGVPRVVRGAADATREATNAVARWARSSVEDIARDLARGPVGEFLRDERGELNVDALMQAATTIKQHMVRMYHGTTEDFRAARTDLPATEGENTLGPGYYLTPDPEHAGLYAKRGTGYYGDRAGTELGANVRAIDVPEDLKLFDLQARDAMAPTEMDAVVQAIRPRDAERASTLERMAQLTRDGQLTGRLTSPQAIWDYLTTGPRPLSVTAANRIIEQAGFDGIRGPTFAEGTAIFEPSVSKLRNAISMRQGGQIDPRLAMNVAGGAAGVGSQEASMTDEEKQNPFLRVSRDLSGGLLGAAAPNLAISGARGLAATISGRAPSLAELEQIRQTLGARQVNIPGTAGQRMTPAELISALGKQNLLFGVKQHVTNIGSQLAELVRTPARAALAGQGDQALLAMRAGINGIPDAMREFAQTWQSGISSTAQPGQRTQAWLPVFRFLGATDDFFRVLGAHMGMATEAQRLVNEAGAKTPQEIQQVLQQNQQKIFQAGQREGAASVFGTMGAQGAAQTDSFSRWKNGLLGAVAQSPQWQDQLKAYGKQGLGLLVDALVPFAGMPARLWDIGLGRIPGVGEVRRLGELGMALRNGDKAAQQRALGELGMQSVVSSVILTQTFAGNVRGPDDPDHPNSVLINGQWVDYSGWGAFQLPLAMPAAAVDEWRKTGNKLGAGDREYLGAVVNSAMKTMSNAYYLNSVFDLANSIGQGGFTGQISKTIASYTDRSIPSGFNQVEQMIDDNVREVSKDFPQSIVDRWKSRVPYLAETLPAQIEPTTGGERQRERQGPVGTLFGVETYNQSPIEQEIYRLNRQGYALRPPRAYPQSVTVKGAQIRLAPDEQRALAQARGQELERVLGARMESSYWGTLSDDQKARLIARALNQATAHNTVTWRRMTPATEQRERIAQGERVVGRLADQGELGGGFTAPGAAA